MTGEITPTIVYCPSGVKGQPRSSYIPAPAAAMLSVDSLLAVTQLRLSSRFSQTCFSAGFLLPVRLRVT